MNSVTTIVTSTTLDVMIYAWLDSKFNRTRSTQTRDNYHRTIVKFRAALRQQGLDLDSNDPQAIKQIALTAQAFSRFSEKGKQLAGATINQRLCAIASFYVWAIRQEYLQVNPLDRVERSKVEPYSRAVPIKAEDAAAKLAAIDRSTLGGKRDYALLLLYFQTGRRLSEVQGLRLQDLEVNGSLITVNFRRTKGGKVMRDSLPAAASNALLEWITDCYGVDAAYDDRFLWINLVGGRPRRDGSKAHRGQLSKRSVAYICERYIGTSKVHTTRHSFAFQMENLGAKISDIQARLGHESLATTSIYLSAMHKDENPFSEALSASFVK